MLRVGGGACQYVLVVGRRIVLIKIITDEIFCSVLLAWEPNRSGMMTQREGVEPFMKTATGTQNTIRSELYQFCNLGRGYWLVWVDHIKTWSCHQEDFHPPESWWWVSTCLPH